MVDHHRSSPAHNPYSPFHPSKENFFGRREIINSFLARVTPGSREYRESKHTLVVGDGGIGKTSVLLQFEALMEDSVDGYCISVDCGDFTYDISDLLAEISSQLPRGRTKPSAKAKDLLRRLSQGVRDGVAIGVGVLPPSLSFEVSPGEFLAQPDRGAGLLRQSASLRDQILGLVPRLDKPLVILLDQLGKVYEAPGGFVFARFLLEVAKSTVGESRLLIAVATRPERKGNLEHWFREELFHPDVFVRIPLYPLGRSAALQLIREPAAQLGITIDEVLVDAMLDNAGTHPYLLQFACFRMWEHLTSQEGLEEGCVAVRQHEIERLVQECHRAVFQDFEPEGRFLLRLLALAWPVPLTAMQIKGKTTAAGKTDLIDVDSVLRSLMSHRHRPLKFSERMASYSVAHDLFAQYIRGHECGEEQVELSVLQQLIDNAPQQYEITGALLSSGELGKLWQYREALLLDQRTAAVIVLSELNQPSWDFRWTRFLIGSPEVDIRYSVARALSRCDSETGRLFLRELADDLHPATRRVVRLALGWTATEFSLEDEWDYGGGRVSGA
jgi:hypothetical protein